jgi:hypothetical protein
MSIVIVGTGPNLGAAIAYGPADIRDAAALPFQTRVGID